MTITLTGDTVGCKPLDFMILQYFKALRQSEHYYCTYANNLKKSLYIPIVKNCEQ